MSQRERRVGLGDPALDRMLGGGIPANQAVLVRGGPGTGKSTLAMQFLQTGLDALCGGGLVRNASVLLQHDGKTNLTALFSVLLSHAFESDYTVTLVPTIALRQSRVESLLAGHGLALDELLAEDRLFVVDLIGDQISAFYRNAADQVLDRWMEDDGLQYVTLGKSPCGFVGTTSLVEYVDEEPYLRVQCPPRTGENPSACE